MQKKSVVRSIEILNLISNSRDGLSLNEIVEKTEYPKTTVYEILLMLLSTDMLQLIEGKTNRYKIGLKAFVIGNSYIKDMDLVNEAKSIVNDLCIDLDMTIFIATLEENQIIYLYKKEPENVPIYTANVANREDAYCTSLGKAILAHLPGFEQDRIIDTMKFRQRTKQTIMNKKDLLVELNKIYKQGYSVDNREILDFVLCLGAPIFNHKGKCIAAISCAGLYGSHRNIELEGEKMVLAAMAISKKLGYTKN
ncbi:MAG: IclR family transcriptional regulator [Spirochaetales bacterium]|nr:IclR family transcriptional regulator [Spirochaetales bacterium]